MKTVTLKIPQELLDQAALVAWKYRHPGTESFLSHLLAEVLRERLAEIADKWRVPDERDFTACEDQRFLLDPGGGLALKDDLDDDAEEP